MSQIAIPFHEISTTQSYFENMVTLRYIGKKYQTSFDYISTIPIDDWKLILTQQKFYLMNKRKHQSNSSSNNSYSDNNNNNNNNNNRYEDDGDTRKHTCLKSC